MSVIDRVMCFFGIHQGEWTTIDMIGCQQSRFCIFCGKPEYRERHNWSEPEYIWEHLPNMGSVKCRDCGKTKAVEKPSEDYD